MLESTQSIGCQLMVGKLIIVGELPSPWITNLVQQQPQNESENYPDKGYNGRPTRIENITPSNPQHFFPGSCSKTNRMEAEVPLGRGLSHSPRPDATESPHNRPTDGYYDNGRGRVPIRGLSVVMNSDCTTKEIYEAPAIGSTDLDGPISTTLHL